MRRSVSASRIVHPRRSRSFADLEAARETLEEMREDTPSEVGFSRVPTILIICAWYGAASLTVVTSKYSLIWLHAPALLSLTQSVVALVLSALIVHGMGTDVSLPRSTHRRILRIGGVYALGFLLTNFSLMSGNASFTETVKAGEPIASVFLAAVVLREVPSLHAMASISVLMMGTALSCVGEGTTFSYKGLVSALLANVMFALRSVFTKQLKSEHKIDVDPTQVFYIVSGVGVGVNVVAYLVADEPTIRDVIHYPAHTRVLLYMFVNGFCYAIYNLCSFMVLQRISVTKHAVFNVFRRIFIIMATMVAFDVELTIAGFVGVFMSVLGFLLSFAEGTQEAERA